MPGGGYACLGACKNAASHDGGVPHAPWRLPRCSACRVPCGEASRVVTGDGPQRVGGRKVGLDGPRLPLVPFYFTGNTQYLVFYEGKTALPCKLMCTLALRKGVGNVYKLSCRQG
jgi:hypothetical protein